MASNEASISKHKFIPKEVAEGMAAQHGIPAADVEPLWIKVNQFRDEITSDLSTSSGFNSVEKTMDFIQQLSMAGQPNKLTETMIQLIEAVHTVGAEALH